MARDKNSFHLLHERFKPGVWDYFRNGFNQYIILIEEILIEKSLRFADKFCLPPIILFFLFDGINVHLMFKKNLRQFSSDLINWGR